MPSTEGRESRFFEVENQSSVLGDGYRSATDEQLM